MTTLASTTSASKTRRAPTGRGSSAASTTAGFDAYTAALEGGDAPLLGHLVVYSVFESRVKPSDLELWFTQLGLDPAFLPPPLRPIDAFEKVTGRDGVRTTYPLDDPAGALADRKRAGEGTGREATLMVRHVRRDNRHIVRHLVREIRDEERTELSYDARLAECVFRRDTGKSAPRGAGTLHIYPDHSRIAALPEAEQATVHALLHQISEAFELRCTFLTGDRLRSLVRAYVEHLGAIKVRSTGGVYFVQYTHAATLARLRDLVARMGQGSNLVRVPIPDQDEMREMVIDAFTRQAKDDLERLSRDIAAAQAGGATDAAAQALYRRFQSVQAATAQHAQLLSTSLGDTDAALHLVKLQLGGLLAAA